MKIFLNIPSPAFIQSALSLSPSRRLPLTHTLRTLHFVAGPGRCQLLTMHWRYRDVFTADRESEREREKHRGRVCRDLWPRPEHPSCFRHTLKLFFFSELLGGFSIFSEKKKEKTVKKKPTKSLSGSSSHNFALTFVGSYDWHSKCKTEHDIIQQLRLKCRAANTYFPRAESWQRRCRRHHFHFPRARRESEYATY